MLFFLTNQRLQHRVSREFSATFIDGDLEKGEFVFQHCISCHGEFAEGDMDIGAPKLSGLNDWYLLRQLLNFKNEIRGSHPEDLFGRQMMEMAQMFNEEMLQDVVAYISKEDFSSQDDKEADSRLRSPLYFPYTNKLYGFPMIIKLAAIMLTVLLALVVGFNVWGVATQGSLEPALNAERDTSANRVVMVFGASGSAGGGLLKAAVEDNEVEKVYVVTRSSTDYIAAAAEDSDKVSVIMHKDFTDYTGLENELGDVSTVLWALGTSSLQVDEATYTLIHVDFPAAFVKAWLSARQAAGNFGSPMAYHFIAGMGTDSSDAPWAHDKRKTERDVAAMAEGTGLRSFSYRSAYIRPISETTNVGHHITEALLRPGKLVTSSKELGQAMLEISARTKELANGTLLDNGDSLAYSKAYLLRLPKGSD